MRVSIIAAVLGSPARLEDEAANLIDALAAAKRRYGADLEVIVVVDGPEWRKLLPERVSDKFKWCQMSRPGNLPAALFNKGLGQVSGAYCGFTWPGCDVETAVPALFGMARKAAAKRAGMMAGLRDESLERRSQTDSWLVAPQDHVPPAYPLGWLQMADIVPMHSAVVRKDLLKDLKFHTDPNFQSLFWWDFCLRTVRQVKIEIDVEVSPGVAAFSWHDFPHPLPVVISHEDVIRTMCDRQSVAPALPRPGKARPASVSIGGVQVRAPAGRPLRVTVLGGLNEPAHNQLCFFNYFERLRLLDWINWRSVLDTACSEADILNSDVLIFSRVKTERGKELIDMCNRLNKATIYMIDDNWLRVGQDVPIYADLFKPGAPWYDNFLAIAGKCGLVLTYNPVLASDLRMHFSHVRLIETNIDLSLFPKRKAGSGPIKRLGFAGSARTDVSAIDAMCALVTERDDLHLVYMSTTFPDSVLAVPPEKKTVLEYVFDYGRYAEQVTNAAPDVMIAPLGRSLFEQSKCPNKYLEISASGALGVYSGIPLYKRYVTDGENGVLVEDETYEAWLEALKTVLERPVEARRMAKVARQRVEKEFATEARMSDFLDVIREALDVAARSAK